MGAMTVQLETTGPVLTVTIDRTDVRNAVDRATADELVEAFRAYDADDDLSVAVLTGAGGTFCAGADLKGIAEGRGNRVVADLDVDGPMGPTRMLLGKPVIAAIEGHAVAGGMELAVWCDLRVVASDAMFGVYCRRWGVPLVDGGTVRLPRLIGQSRAMDLILTGRAVGAVEALDMGLANRVCEPGAALATAIELGEQIAAFPQACMRNDRRSAIEQWELVDGAAMANEIRVGLDSLSSAEAVEGAARFAGGAGRGGTVH